MKGYDRYKESGVEWIGEIPEHWTLTKLKFLGEAFGGLTYSPNDIVDNSNEGKLVLRSSNIQNGQLDLNDNVYVNLEISDKLTLRKGDILICSRNGSKHLIGKNICIDEQMEGNTFGAFMMIFRTKKWKFLYQYFNSPIFTSQSSLFLSSTINQLTSGTLKDFFIAVPNSEEEQTQIAAFLDYKTNLIDATIEKKKRLIELLKEKRQAVINEAVTKGLNPNVPMKYSGVEWLGEIPEDWSVVKLKHIVDMRSGNFISAEIIEEVGAYPVYGGNGLRGFTSQCTHEGYFPLIGRQGALCGNINYASGQFWATEHAVVVSSKRQTNTYWIGELLRLMNLNQYSQASAQPGLSVEKILNLRVPFPTFEEQNLIASKIEDLNSKIDTSLLNLESSIEKLQTYRQSLISEAVTGKIDVRDWQPTKK